MLEVVQLLILSLYGNIALAILSFILIIVVTVEKIQEKSHFC